MDISVMGDMADFEKKLSEEKERNPYKSRKLLQGTSVYENFNILDEIFNKNTDNETFNEDLLKNDEFENQSNAPISNKKVGRNDPCPCGSGKKYKKCCLRKRKFH
ncbi:MAG: SEC-C domain-containing protein [Flavobacteriaceae bacterium]|nr:SEC-C domain-containing protein [Flavobacteriaceae bacterium]